jgi:hypothetical protein
LAGARVPRLPQWRDAAEGEPLDCFTYHHAWRFLRNLPDVE